MTPCSVSRSITDFAFMWRSGSGWFLEKCGWSNIRALAEQLAGDLGILRVADHLVASDQSAVEKVHQRDLERNHSVLGAGENLVVDAVGFIVPQQGADGGGVDHDLEDRDASRAVALRQE